MKSFFENKTSILNYKQQLLFLFLFHNFRHYDSKYFSFLFIHFVKKPKVKRMSENRFHFVSVEMCINKFELKLQRTYCCCHEFQKHNRNTCECDSRMNLIKIFFNSYIFQQCHMSWTKMLSISDRSHDNFIASTCSQRCNNLLGEIYPLFWEQIKLNFVNKLKLAMKIPSVMNKFQLCDVWKVTKKQKPNKIAKIIHRKPPNFLQKFLNSDLSA